MHHFRYMLLATLARIYELTWVPMPLPLLTMWSKRCLPNSPWSLPCSAGLQPACSPSCNPAPGPFTTVLCVSLPWWGVWVLRASLLPLACPSASNAVGELVVISAVSGLPHHVLDADSRLIPFLALTLLSFVV